MQETSGIQVSCSCGIGTRGGNGTNMMYGIALPVSLFFLVKSFIDAGKLPKKMKERQERFKREYACPACGWSFGNEDFPRVAMRGQCPNPNCRVTYVTNAAPPMQMAMGNPYPNQQPPQGYYR